jgi:very-short-patch-repair endonuclease
MNKQYKIWRTETALWEKLRPIAREMRSKPTVAENLLWQRLRRHKLSGYKFRRQHNIERFIVDFYCAQAHLVIEVDGPIHQYQKYEDLIRQEYLESQNLKVQRFTNDDILNNPDKVLKQILSYLPASSLNNE